MAEDTEVPSMGECGREGWVLTVGVASWSWWFSGGSVLASLSSRISSSSMRGEITVDCANSIISHSATSCISSSSMMCTTRSSKLDRLVGEFSADST